jgi:hypothetical protein
LASAPTKLGVCASHDYGALHAAAQLRSDLWQAKFHTFRVPSTFAMSALRVRRSAVHDVRGKDGAVRSIAWSEIELSVLVLEGKAFICAVMMHL